VLILGCLNVNSTSFDGSRHYRIRFE
jgi:hypothetical protein